MAHKTLIGGTAYEIKGGRTLIGGTGYDVKSGRTLVGGTGYDVKFFTPNIPSFANATLSEIVSALEYHYNGLIDISDYWNVGDEKTISLAAMSAYNNVPSHPAQDVTITIIGINHDILTTPINGHTKSAITVQTKNCLYNLMWMIPGSQDNPNPFAVGWRSIEARWWCIYRFDNALPTELKNICKSVNKKTRTRPSDSTIETTEDKSFLVSAVEVFGSGINQYADSNEGTQYPYYQTASNRIKGYRTVSARAWWTRSPQKSNQSQYNYNYVTSSGTQSRTNCNSSQGFSVAFCL